MGETYKTVLIKTFKILCTSNTELCWIEAISNLWSTLNMTSGVSLYFSFKDLRHLKFLAASVSIMYLGGFDNGLFMRLFGS